MWELLLAIVPTPTPEAPPGLEEMGDTFIAWLKWGLAVCGVGGLLVCGIMMAVGRRNRSAMAADGLSGVPWVLGGLTLGVVAAAIVATVLKI